MINPSLKLTEATVAMSATALVAMTFTPSEITAISIAAATLIGVTFTGIVNIIIAIRATGRKVDHVVTEVGELKTQGKAIEGHVNSAASTSSAKIDAMQQQITQLTQLLAEAKQIAALQAQAQAQAPAPAPKS